ncbi:hypothetical protein BRC95_01400 [Halobacteriales archaeon QS_5_68_33]|nr:MAG: hypothetical protein BRC95_01400 [Halobacteriales archaeon QS_5_68_33]
MTALARSTGRCAGGHLGTASSASRRSSTTSSRATTGSIPHSVRVESERAGEDIRLRVADDGPGIPDHERSAVGESTEITQLEHGSGLGLWVVRWVCESCGGRLRFGESDLGGAAVVLSLTGADG